VNAALRQSLCAFAVVAVAGLALGGAVAVGLSLADAKASVAALDAQSQALQAREKRFIARPGRERGLPPSFEARTITLAGAALQQRIESAVASAKGRLASSKVDVESHGAERRIEISAELTIAESDLQGLLFDLETGRPYVFVESFEARAPEAPGEGEVLRVSLNLSGQWSGTP
jgi:general secretion pathway protein M